MPLLPVVNFVTLKFGVYYETFQSPKRIRLGLVGSPPELGNWDVRKCVLAMENPDHSNCWIAVVRVPEKCEIQWKWVVMSADKSLVFRWEETVHSLKTGSTSGRLRTWWDGSVDFFPGTFCELNYIHYTVRPTVCYRHRILVSGKQVFWDNPDFNIGRHLWQK